VCEAPSGLKVLSRSSGDTAAVKLPLSPQSYAITCFTACLPLSPLLPLSPFRPPVLSLGPLTDTDGQTLSHTLRSDAALSYSVAVKEGGRAYRSGGQCPVTQLSIEVRERTSIQKKERREEGGETKK